MVCSSVRASWHMEVADALTEDGWLLGRQVVTLHDAGAYTRFSSYGATKHSFHLAGAYTIPHMHTDAYVVWTNRVPSTAMRGFGVTSVSFAVEMQMNRGAHVLGLDPWEFRLRNASRIGEVVRCRVVLEDPSAVQTMQAVAEAAGKELSAEYRTMTNAPRDGDMLPAHLADQMSTAKLADAKYRKGA
jgi:CO/xanthine dehydrogenase Mo-binding subunit